MTDAITKRISALLAPVFLISGLMVLTNLGAFPGIVHEIAASPTLLLLSGYIAFVPGIAIVVVHNRWRGLGPLLVTLCGWMLVVVGTIRILFAYRLAPVLDPIKPAVVAILPVLGVLMLVDGLLLAFVAWRRAG